MARRHHQFCHCENCCLEHFICFKKSGGKYEMEKISKRFANIWETFVGFVCATCFFFRVRPEIEKVSKRTAFQLNIFVAALSHLGCCDASKTRVVVIA